jgi:hypothetical protein
MDHLTLIHIVSRFRNSAAQYVLNAWLLIPNTFIALAIFLPFRIPERQPYSSTFGFIRSIFEFWGFCLLYALCNKMAATWSSLVAAILFFVGRGVKMFSYQSFNEAINQSITLFKRQWYLTKGKSLY